MKKALIITGLIIIGGIGGVWMLGGEKLPLVLAEKPDVIRMAVVETDCLKDSQKDQSACKDAKESDSITFCTTTQKELLECELSESDKKGISETKKRDFVVCADARGHTDVRQQTAGQAVAVGCQNVVSDSLITDSFGFATELEKSLSAKCGFEVFPLDWGCCPHCLAFQDGCPPCKTLCKYGDRWKTHELECVKD